MRGRKVIDETKFQTLWGMIFLLFCRQVLFKLQFYLSISPLVGEECLDHFLDGHVELEAEVFLDGSMESISDIFLEPTLILSE